MTNKTLIEVNIKKNREITCTFQTSLNITSAFGEIPTSTHLQVINLEFALPLFKRSTTFLPPESGPAHTFKFSFVMSNLSNFQF
jgi:hypothetical protein